MERGPHHNHRHLQSSCLSKLMELSVQLPTQDKLLTSSPLPVDFKVSLGQKDKVKTMNLLDYLRL